MPRISGRSTSRRRRRACTGRARAPTLSGKRPAALTILKTLEALAKHRYVSPFEFASIHFALDQTDLGFRWLAKACQGRCFELIAIKVDPRFDVLRGDRRFQAVTEQVGLP